MPRKHGSPAPVHHRHPSIKVGIVGAGLSGLACACSLGGFASVVVFERQLSIEEGYGGEIELRGAAELLDRLCGPSTWSELRSQSNSLRPSSVPVQAVRRVLYDALHPSTVVCFGVAAVCPVQDGTRAGLQLQPTRLLLSDGRLSQPFDVLIDAGGLDGTLQCALPSDQVGKSSTSDVGQRSACRASAAVAAAAAADHGIRVADAHAAIGDSRAARRKAESFPFGVGWLRKLVMGVRRNRHGGSDALRDGAALGDHLGRSALSGTFSSNAIFGTLYACEGCRRSSQPSDPRQAMRGLLLLLVVPLLACPCAWACHTYTHRLS